MRIKASDVAREAGVSAATVDRVINGRGSVAPDTVQRVTRAMDKLGYNRVASPIVSVAAKTVIEFLIPDGPGSFMKGLAAEIAETQRHFIASKVDIQCRLIPPVDPDALADALDAVNTNLVQGVVVVAIDGPRVKGAIRRLSDAGVHVVTIVSDSSSSNRVHFAGIDNVAAGRCAAHLMGKFLTPHHMTHQARQASQPDPLVSKSAIIVVVGSLLLRDHVDRVTGFQQVLAESFPQLEVLALVEAGDDAEKAKRLVEEQLGGPIEIAGVYSAAGGTRGVVAAVEGTGHVGDTCVIAHELTGDARCALERGTLDAVLNQNAGHEVRSAIRVIRSLVSQEPVIPAQEQIRLDIFVQENLP